MHGSGRATENNIHCSDWKDKAVFAVAQAAHVAVERWVAQHWLQLTKHVLGMGIALCAATLRRHTGSSSPMREMARSSCDISFRICPIRVGFDKILGSYSATQ